MKKRILSNLICGCVLAMIAGNQIGFAKEFTDVNKMDADFVAIDYLSSQDVLNGYEDGSFKPGQLVNRAESLKMIFAGLKTPVPGGYDMDPSKLFPDVAVADWYAPYVALARSKGIISGNQDGTFAPARTVTRAEFLKMLLETVGFKKELWVNQQIFADVAADAWYTPYMNYAGKSGMLSRDSDNKLYPNRELSRAEVAKIIYLTLVIINSQDMAFLSSQADAQISQIENYLSGNDVVSADRSAKLAVDLTQQALKLSADPSDAEVLSKAKIARAYSLLVSSFVAALESRYGDARELANQTITKADEAWQVNHDTETVTKHLKDKAAEILAQLEGK